MHAAVPVRCKHSKNQGRKLYSKAQIKRSSIGSHASLWRGPVHKGGHAQDHSLLEEANHIGAAMIQFAVKHVGIGTGNNVQESIEMTVEGVIACTGHCCDSPEHHLQMLRN